ncbi:discoidin domain-containing receptor tyrosine kinase B-like isoform X2 [Condylostylus longicornis]|uniref:discoidin domain-containing receptor tyrosine kinase B-like isoform X2 n=1 Tax=Condylostylus longicornis TaxID=2530218 RepID=UPI00244DBF38|nr:discoidin domain-containing receptor tyrosine kinase B-like isoform X2 [Condylostylus longicornis]
MVTLELFKSNEDLFAPFHHHSHQYYKSRFKFKYLMGIFLIIFSIFQRNQVNALDLATCNNPLGMESGSIADFQITASSAHDMGNVGPQHARLKIDNNGGAWCPKYIVSRALKDYIQIDLLRVHVITSIRTQGRFGKGQGQEYTEAYVLEYWRPGFNKWIKWKNIQGKEILTGNINTYSEVENILQPIIFASKVRIYPYSQYDRTVCLRAEINGCPWEEGIISYSIPKGIQRSMEIDLSDKTYDGQEENDRLVNGLGQLVDGQKGRDNFRTDIHGFGKGYEWVGWTNDTPMLSGKPVEITFEFDAVRNFSAIILHTNNMFSREVQVFRHAKIFFSIGGIHFVGEPVQYSYMTDMVSDQARDITIKLHNRIGRFLKIQLYFGSRWILLSEISFISVAATGNFTDEEVKETLLSQKTTKNSGKGEQKLLSPRPIDQAPERNLVGIILVSLTTVILITMAVVLLIVVRKRKARDNDALDGFQYNFNPERFEVNKRVNSNFKVSTNDNDEWIEKSSLYHEPFNLNMSTNSAKRCSSNNLQRYHINPEYTDVPDIVYQEYAEPSQMRYQDTTKIPAGYVSVRRTPSPRNNTLPNVLSTTQHRYPSEIYYAATAICKNAGPQNNPHYRTADNINHSKQQFIDINNFKTYK